MLPWAIISTGERHRAKVTLSRMLPWAICHSCVEDARRKTLQSCFDQKEALGEGSGGCDEGIMRIAELVSPKTNFDWADAREMSLPTDNLCHRKETRWRSNKGRDQQPMKHGMAPQALSSPPHLQ
nr:hypothetical protein Iba_chr02bCG9380 [Ipomoea batatas]